MKKNDNRKKTLVTDYQFISVFLSSYDYSPTRFWFEYHGYPTKDNEYFDFALKRFKRSCEKAGILNEYRKREYYEKPTQERKRKKAAAVKREKKRVSRERNRTRRLY